MREETFSRQKKEWPRVPFAAVVRLVKDRVDPATSGLTRYVAGEHMDTDDLRLRRWGEIDGSYLGPAFHMRFKPGHVLYGSRRTYLRKVAVADFEGICANTTFVLEPKDPAVLLPEFLPFVMQTEAFHDHSIKQSKGSVNPYINFSDLAWYEFPLPPPDEQRRLVEVLRRVESCLEAYARLHLDSSILAEAWVESALGRSGVKDFYWLEERSDIRYGLTVDKARREAVDRLPYLRVANVLRGTLNLSEVKEIGFYKDDNQYLLQEGDVLVVEGHANPMDIGRAALWNGEIAPCAHQNHIIRVRCKDGLDPRFLVLYLNSKGGREYFQSRAKSTSGLNTINSTVVRQVPIPEMSLAQQNHIVSHFHDIMRSANQVTSRIENAILIKQRLLSELE